MLRTGTNCSNSATVPNHVYRSRLFLMNAFLSFFVKSSNLKYLQCCNGPARHPVRRRNIGVPATGTKLRGRKMMNSRICRKEKGEYTAGIVGLPSCFTGSLPSGSRMREDAIKSVWPSLMRTASKTSTRVSSTKKASKRSETMAAPSPRTRKVALSHARWPWKIARKATWSRSAFVSSMLWLEKYLGKICPYEKIG